MTTYTWTNSDGDNWTTPFDWTPLGPPGPSDTADIPVATTVTVASNLGIGSIVDSGMIDIASGVVSAAGPINGGGSIVVDGQGAALAALQLTQSATIDNLNIGIGGGATLSAGGTIVTLTLGPNDILNTFLGQSELGAQGSFVNQGAIRVSGGSAQTDAARFANVGTLFVASGQSFQSNAWSFSNSGTVAVRGSLTMTPPASMPPGVRGPSAFQNFGSLLVGGNVQVGVANFMNGGAITIAAGSTLTDSGASFSEQGSSSITVNAFGTFDLEAGSASLASDSIAVAGGTMIFNPGSLTQTNTLLISAGGLVEVVSGGGAEGFDFSDGTGTLQLDAPDKFIGTVSGFSGGGSIDLRGFDAASTTGTLLAGNVLSVSDDTHSAAIQLDPSESFAGQTFRFVSDGAGGAYAQSEIPCFCAGTRILTPSGEVPVERLRIGDEVTTLSGTAKPITWIGSGRTHVTDGNRQAATPIIVRRGALADGVPHRDLRLTRGHSLYVDGRLVTAETLINGRSVVLDTSARTVDYHHIEVAGHDVLVADGAPAETYRDDGNRKLFLLGIGASRTAKSAEVPPCAPIVTEGPEADRLWRVISDRAGRAGLFSKDPDLHLLADGSRIDPDSVAQNRYVFRLDARPHRLRLMSRNCVPAEIGHNRDQRRLGIAVGSILLRQRGIELRVAHDAAVLSEGFHAPEPAFRWTDGDAVLPASLLAWLGGPAVIEVQMAHALPYPIPGEPGRETRLCA